MVSDCCEVFSSSVCVFILGPAKDFCERIVAVICFELQGITDLVFGMLLRIDFLSFFCLCFYFGTAKYFCERIITVI